ncbi:AAA family ATPase [Idiomarina seosinensis]|uniref:SPOR domain-containing protein n=1 Tax=Idiomarina seosinensis TaxID=281739 RepID=UPI00384FF982
MQAVAQQHIVAAPVKIKASQQNIIDQLHQLSQQNDSLVMLHGGDGSGKTTIAELFIEQASNYAECAFVTANERSSVDRLRAQVLNQLFGTISLSDETLSRQMQRQAPVKHAVIVIDNGEHLPDSFLAECVSTVQQLSAIGQKVSVIIVADSRWAYQQKPAPHLRVQGPTMLEVAPMSHDEQIRYVQELLPERQQRLWNFDRIQQFLNTINGYPGEIQQRLQLALTTQAQRYKDQPTNETDPAGGEADDSVSINTVTDSKTRRPVKLIYIFALTLVLSLAAAAFFNKETLEQYWQSETPQPESELAASPVAEAEAEAGTTDNSSEPEATAKPAELPSFEPMEQPSLELMPKELAISYREALDNLNRTAAAENDPRELELSLIKVQQPEQTNSQPAAVRRPYQTDAIAAQNSQAFALQVAIISSEDLLTQFRQQHGISTTTDVYQRNDGSYVIVYGVFDTLEQARAAVTELPASVQQMEPWAKTYLAIQKEIEPAGVE